MEDIPIKKNKFLLLAGAVAILNPLLSGLLIGLFMTVHPALRREGIVISLFSVAWGLIALSLIARFAPALP